GDPIHLGGYDAALAGRAAESALGPDGLRDRLAALGRAEVDVIAAMPLRVRLELAEVAPTRETAQLASIGQSESHWWYLLLDTPSGYVRNIPTWGIERKC